MSETLWTVAISTKRLILRPQYPSDYDDWYAGFSGRLPSQRQYDDGLVNLNHCDRQWFANLCQRHQQEAANDQFFILGIFSRQTGQHIGNIDFSTIRRGNYQWAVLEDVSKVSLTAFDYLYHLQSFTRESAFGRFRFWLRYLLRLKITLLKQPLRLRDSHTINIGIKVLARKRFEPR